MSGFDFCLPFVCQTFFDYQLITKTGPESWSLIRTAPRRQSGEAQASITIPTRRTHSSGCKSVATAGDHTVPTEHQARGWFLHARSNLAAWKSSERSSFHPFEPTPETDGAANHQQLPGHLGGQVTWLCVVRATTRRPRHRLQRSPTLKDTPLEMGQLP